MSGLEDVALYEWQEQCLAVWKKTGYRGIARVATGAGKTILALAAVLRLREGSGGPSPTFLGVRIVVPRVFLAQQWKRAIVRYLGVDPVQVGLFGGDARCDATLPYVIYVLDSARYHVARHIVADAKAGRRVLLICDEVHHFGSSENAHVFDFIPLVPTMSWFALGLSATPDAEHLDDVIIPALGPIIFTYDIDDATKAGITAPWQVFPVAVPFTNDEEERYDMLSNTITRLTSMLYKRSPALARAGGPAFIARLRSLAGGSDSTAQLARRLSSLLLRRKALVSLAEARVGCAVELAHLLLPQSKAIFFTERIRQADALFARLDALFPGRIARYHSGMDAEVKRRALEAFSTGASCAIVCCRALDEGLNVPQADVGIIVSTGNNARQRIQRLGRLLRKTPDNAPKRVFYLYVPNTTEPDALLIHSPADTADQAIVGMGGHDTEGRLPYGSGEHTGKPSVMPQEISYTEDDMGQGSLVNPTYDYLANKVIQNLEANNATPAQLRTAKAHLTRGLTAADWLMDEQSCLALLAHANRTQKPYLQTMLLLIRQIDQ